MTFQVGSTEVMLKPTTSPDAPDSNYAGLDPSSIVLPKGHQRTPENRALRADTTYERDVVVTLRDGVKLRADIFRPEGEKTGVPAIVAWSPYGKTGTGFFNIGILPERVGVPQSALSGYEKFEGPDPAEWVAEGYAIVNIDSRGVFDSDGNIRWSGSAEGRDGYDAIEEIAKMPWCNGKVALAGNSWLAMAQWFIAAEKPPHLACIAPLEGASDMYREMLCRGGVPFATFTYFLSTKLYGRQQQEDVVSMLMKYPYMNEYWADKRAAFDRIDVPAYILASYSTALHTVGSFRAFEQIPHSKKWRVLRVHPTQEWHDLYQQTTIDDLRRFFDHYLKGEENGWETTEKVRLSIVGFGSETIVNQAFPTWPIPSTNYSTFYLDADGKLSTKPSSKESEFTYQADVPAQQMDADTEELQFPIVFEKKSYLVGSAKAVLYMSCPSHNDLDVFVQLRKADKSGKLLQHLNIPITDMQPMGISSPAEVSVVNTNVYLGPNGVLRASHRATDDALSYGNWQVHDHTEAKNQPVSPGEVVKLEIGMWPTGMLFEAGEQLVLKVAGHPLVLAEFVPLRGTFQAESKGKHVLHVGGSHESHVVVPFVEL